ncbi:MAG: peptidase, family C56 [Rhodospirillaceae bacterium]|nr:peptidase, family C56 [Rhodospirillaceae bacterium]|tara:strand:+ start:152 stop:676 length:525 start_codon:yes stop_codon:yes gene_type:complete
MTKTTLSGQKIAIMVAAGFDEKNFVEIQKMLMGQNAQLKVISASTGLVQGWTGTQLGMFYPVDSHLSETLAVDFDALIIPSGKAHLATLAEELHSARIIKAFLRENMPILVQGDALDLISEIDTVIQVELIRAQGEIGLHNRILWAGAETSIAQVTREFVAVCLSKQDGDSAAA